MKAYVYIGVTDESVLNDGRVDRLMSELRQAGADVHVMALRGAHRKQAYQHLCIHLEGSVQKQKVKK